MGKTFELLNIDQSFSRPRTSNGNAYSESQFKTTKYHPGYPGWFPDLPTAWAYFEEFFCWYNDIHRHSGIAFLTPTQLPQFGPILSNFGPPPPRPIDS